MSRIIAQLILIGTRIIARAVARAVQQELEYAAAAARQRQNHQPGSQSPLSSSPMSLNEAMKILNVDTLDPELVEKNYKHLFEANSRENGGSFYIQSKVFRAKERLDQELS